jgi:hypothetical protein
MVRVFLKIRRGLITVMEVLDALIRCSPGEREVFLARSLISTHPVRIDESYPVNFS